MDIRQGNFDESRLTQAEFYSIFTRKIVELIEKYQAEEWIFCGSQDVNFLAEINAQNPKIKLFLEGGNVTELLNEKKDLNFFGIVIANDRISRSEVKIAHDSGVRVAIFNIKSLPGNLDAVEKSPDYLITDNITLLQDILR